MTYPQAIVAAAGILAGAIVITSLAQTAPAGLAAPAAGKSVRYQISSTPGKSVANAWRLDMKTGDLYRCFATAGPFGAVCRQARFYDAEDAGAGGSGGPGEKKAGLPAGEKLARWSR